MSASHALKRLYGEVIRMIRIAGNAAMRGVAVGRDPSSNDRPGCITTASPVRASR
jgi:hypothetical protein